MTLPSAPPPLVLCDLWTPIGVSVRLKFAPVPLTTWFYWHALNADAIARSERGEVS